jgi:hypothetical protein
MRTRKRRKRRIAKGIEASQGRRIVGGETIKPQGVVLGDSGNEDASKSLRNN